MGDKDESDETPMYQALRKIMDKQNANPSVASLQDLDSKLDSKFAGLLGL